MAQPFSFGFENDDIEGDSREYDNEGNGSMDVDPKEQPALLPPQLQNLDELVSPDTRMIFSHCQIFGSWFQIAGNLAWCQT